MGDPESGWTDARKGNSPGERIRTAGAATLAEALSGSRSRTIELARSFALKLGPEMRVPEHADRNLPLWELGHVGWFQDWWIARNPQRALGHRADPLAARLAPRQAGADSLYDSSNVAHAQRWQLELPDLAAQLTDIAAGLQQTLLCLREAGADAAALYFYRLVLLHEDMHAEAGIYMAQALDVALAPTLLAQRPRQTPGDECHCRAGLWTLGQPGPGFAFDNELDPHTVALPRTVIDARAVSWARYLPFVEAGGYGNARWWSKPGWQWRGDNCVELPRYLRRAGAQWECRRFGIWQSLELAQAAVHVSGFEAQAWCNWAGRRRPSEGQWERAAVSDPAFEWGEVWEWTAEPFMPYPGFQPHPYVDYSAPWFGSRQILRGASLATDARMRHPRYRNFFPPGRNDLFSGFRSCAN